MEEEKEGNKGSQEGREDEEGWGEKMKKRKQKGKEEKSKDEIFASNTNLKTSLRLFIYFEYDKMSIL